LNGFQAVEKPGSAQPADDANDQAIDDQPPGRLEIERAFNLGSHSVNQLAEAFSNPHERLSLTQLESTRSLRRCFSRRRLTNATLRRLLNVRRRTPIARFRDDDLSTSTRVPTHQTLQTACNRGATRVQRAVRILDTPLHVSVSGKRRAPARARKGDFNDWFFPGEDGRATRS